MELTLLLLVIGDFFGVFVDARGQAGALALLWDKKVGVTRLSSSFHQIDFSV